MQSAIVPPHGILQQLILAGNKIGDDGVETLCKSLASRSAKITKLDLANCGLHESSAVHLSKLLKETKYDIKWLKSCIKSEIVSKQDFTTS